MKKIILLLLIFIPLFTIASQKNSAKRITLKRTPAEIKIDGIIDPIWFKADSACKFFQLQPYYNQEPSVKTVAKLLTDDESLYCLVICYDNKNNIEVNTGVHDQYTGDAVSLMLDTFGDNQTAYKFAMNASGVRVDCRLLDDARNRDYSWDGIWQGESKIYDWGYVVEMKIPYKSIKFDRNINEWGLDFDRWRPWTKEDLYWCEYELNEGQRISKFGRLVFEDFRPTSTGLNLELYPVGIAKSTYLGDNKYDFDPSAGLDVFYNPSQKLTFQLTANPDFAQIEADPFDFNISRYESYFSERRPFFTEGNEVFNPSGRQSNSGFYRPLELFYSRRIGKLLPDGQEVPLYLGTKAFGRLNDFEYGGFVASTGAVNYVDEDDVNQTEERAIFGSARVKKQILDNSSVGVLFVGKQTKTNTYGVIDIDGAFRSSTWQLAYQFARSINNSDGDFAASAGLTSFGESWANLVRLRAIGKDFDVQEIGYVPWKGTLDFLPLTGPIWFPKSGAISQIFIYGGPAFSYEDADLYTDHAFLLGYNMQFRSNWGFEINLSYGKSKDGGTLYNSYDYTLSSWYDISPKWHANLYGGYSKTYNFDREYLAFYSWLGSYFEWSPLSELKVGTSYDMFIEGNPAGSVEDITYNARPFVSVTPVNDLNMRLYVDNVFVKSSDKMESMIFGFLFSWNFLAKSWIYFAINEHKDRSDQYDVNNNLLPNKMHTKDRASVFKIKYLYYF